MKEKMFFFLFLVTALSLSAQEVESYDWNLEGTSTSVTTTTTVTVTKDSAITPTTGNWISQELIVLGGGGYGKSDGMNWSDYGFGEARWMFGKRFRIGPYVSYIAFNGEETYKNPIGQYTGQEVSFGGSLDSYGAFNLRNTYYAWMNISYRKIKDSYHENLFDSKTETSGIGIMFGYFVTNNRQDWFGNHKLMLSGFIPTHAEVVGTWNGSIINNLEPYNKRQFRGTYEMGLKRIGNKVDFEPLLHTGGGYEWGNGHKFYEVGTGFDFGIFNNWYHEVAKFKVFWRQDLNATELSGWRAECVFNLSQFIQAIKK